MFFLLILNPLRSFSTSVAFVTTFDNPFYAPLSLAIYPTTAGKQLCSMSLSEKLTYHKEEWTFEIPDELVPEWMKEENGEAC